MEFIGTQEYQKKEKAGKLTMPHTDDPEKMDNRYFLSWAEYIWGQYVTSKTVVPFGGESVSRSGKKLSELRAYGIGMQDVARYQALLDPCEPNKNEGFMNINWDIVQIMPKFRDLVRGKMIGLDFDIVTTAMDETSTKERIEEINKLKMMVNPKMQQLIQATGVKPNGVKLPPGIESMEDIEMYNKMGGLRLDHEIMITDAIESTNYESNWKQIRALLAEDIIDLNMCSTHTYIEKATGIVKLERVEPELVVSRPSKYQDHHDSDFRGFIKRMTISELRLESNLSEEEILKIVKKYRGQNGNSLNLGVYREGDTNYQPTGGFSAYTYDNFEVWVMVYYFIGKEVEKYVIGNHRDGNCIYDKVGYDSTLDKKDEKRGKSIDEKVIEWVYSAKWIIGTQFVFDNGKEYGVVRQGYDGIKRATLPITLYTDRSPSLVERCIPFLDDLQLSVLKKRNAFAKMPPGPRMGIDLSLLEDSVDIGSNTYSILELVELYPKTGVFPFRSVGEWDDQEMSGSNRPPIIPMESGIQEDVALCLQDVQFNIEQIRNVTALNEVSDGTTQQGDMLVKVLEGLNAATNTALKPHFQLYFGLYETQSKYVAQKWQVAVVSGEIKTKYIPIGDNILKSVLLSKDLYDYDFGIKILIKPTEEDRKMLMGMIMQMRQSNEISPEGYFVLYNMINAGDFKKAQFYLAKESATFRKMLQAQQLELVNQQAQANAQAAQAAEQAKMQTEQMKHQMEMERIQFEAAIKKAENEQKHAFRMEELQLIKGMELSRDMLGKTMDMAGQQETLANS